MELTQYTMSLQVPGANAPSHYFWLFPIVVPRPDVVVKHMNSQVIFHSHCGD